MAGVQTLVMSRNQLDDAPGEAHEFLVMIYGPRIGHKSDLQRDAGPIIFGRDVDATITIEDDSVSRKHCQLLYEEHGWIVEDLGSTNGTYVAGEPIRRVLLRDGDLVKLGGTIFKFLSTRNVEAAYHEEIYRMAIFDGLTQIHNRRYFEEFTERELSRSRRHGSALSLLLFDIDHFKEINDQFGHLMGDHVLRSLAGRIRRRVRREELFARYAGDEFVVVLPETSHDNAHRFGETLRALVADTDFTFEGRDVSVTVSVGVGHFRSDMRRPAELVAVADAALYRAKGKGRNKVCV